MKKVAMINYIKVLILAIVTVLLVIVLTNLYNDKRKYELSNDDVMSFLSAVKYDELREYLVENTDGFIYVASSTDTTLDSFELNFKDYILNDDLDKDIVYLDSSNFSTDMYNELKKNYFADNLSIDNEIGKSTLFAIRDGKIIAVLNINCNDVTLNDVKYFVSNYEVSE